MTTPNEPERLRRDIERTQRSLSTDVDLLAEKVTPGRIVHRRVNRARHALTTVRDRVMGTAQSGASSAGDTMSAAGNRIGGAASSAASSVGDAASSAASSVAEGTQAAASTVARAAQEAPQAIRRETQGNPLAAGLIAFGAGWLLSSLVPATKAEERLAEQAKDTAQEYGRPVAEHLAQEVRDNLREPAQQAVESVRDTASDAASTVADEARQAASDVAGRAQEARTSVQQQHES
ncbi:DUF3618 domain-containing protein [Actinophytocola sp.]|uniref:DUF3618 domain-containing protein n=1 Tax=Actinophytocola sp. TaxID=1872138 RepID=UPI003899A6BA